MDDLEQQIRHWADATMRSTAEEPAPVPRPAAARKGHRRRVALVAAVVVAVAGIGVGLALARSGADEVRTGPATGRSTTIPELPPPPLAFRVLAQRVAPTERVGTLAAASTPDQLARLWDDLGPVVPGSAERRSVPAVDFDRQVVVSITLSTGACSELAGFDQGPGRPLIRPRFTPDASRRGGPFAIQYVAALDWVDLGDETVLELGSEDGTGDPGAKLELRRDRPWLVTVDLVVPDEVAAGDQVPVEVIVNNASGAPLETSGCGAPFAGGGKRGGGPSAPGGLLGLTGFATPAGRAV